MLSPGITARLQLLVGTQFQVLFHSHSWVLFAFPSRYLFTIGHQRVFSLRRWSSLIPTRFLVSRCTWDTARAFRSFAYRAFTFCGQTFQTGSARSSGLTLRSRNPTRQVGWFGLFRFRSPLLPESLLLSFPPLTKMFQFSGLSPLTCVKDNTV